MNAEGIPDRMVTMMTNFKNTLHALFRSWKSMLLFQIGYSILFTIIQYSLFQLLLNIALRLTGYSFLNSANLGRFLITPPAIIMLLILFLATALLTYLDACILMGGYQASLAHEKLHMKDLFLYGAYRCFHGFRLTHLYFALPLLAYQTLSSVFFLYEICFRVNPYSTFLPQLFSKISYCIIIGTCFILLTVFALRQVFAMSYWYLGRCPLRDCKKMSPGLVKKHFLQLLIDIVLLNGWIVLLWFVLRFLCQILVVLTVNLLAPGDLKVAMVLSINNSLSVVLIWFSSCIGVFLNTAMITRQFYHFSGTDVILEFRLDYPDTPLRRRWVLITAVTALTIGLFCFLYYGFYNGALLSERQLTPVQIYCHRGLSSEAPENTMAAVDLAIDSLSDGVEIDVQETKDGVVVVSHDNSLSRTAGINANISDLTYEELLRYDVSKDFSKDFGFTTIPTLEEVMELVKGRAHLLIELKRNPSSQDLAEKVVDLIDQYDMLYQCSIQSSDYAYLRQVNELNPDISLGYILTAAIGNYYKNDMVDFFCVRSMFVNDTTVSKAHQQGKAVYAWTVNTRAETERMKNAQVDVIITDYPAKAREVIYREEGSETILNLLRLVL